MISICYLTARKDCRAEWFFDSLRLQIAGARDIQLIMVDFWKDQRPLPKLPLDVLHVSPKPNVWQGKHRLTGNDYFTASSARNTALCYANDGHIVFVDDLSVVMPGWLGAVRESIAGGYIACGAFRKVNKLVVEKGIVKSFEDHKPGHDSRWGEGHADKPVPCPPNWLFGCSCCIPVSALEKINGWPEAACDSTGVAGEDSFTGIALARSGHKLMYDRRMMTLEAEDLHQQKPVLLRMDKGKIGTPDSKSHAVVRMLQNCSRFDNDFTPFPDIAALRQHILRGGEFPIPNGPLHDWYDSQALSEL